MRLREIAAAVLGLIVIGYGNYAYGQMRPNPGFKQHSIDANDDGSSPLVPLGWTINFFGRQRSNAYVNNNGNITFDAPLPEYTPFGLTGVQREIIAPFFADVDTRAKASQLVTYGQDFVDGRRAFGVNWVNVGYFNSHDDRLNSFQLVLIERPDTGNGNFDIEFNYGTIQWETGDASGGTGGYGGVSASAGWSNGSGQPGTSFELAGSLIPGSFLDNGPFSLAAGRTPGVSITSTTNPAGRWRFRARDGLLIPPISIRTGCPLPNATAGRTYAFRLEAAGSRPPYRWTIDPDPGAPALPNLALSQAGLLSGAPPAPGDYGFTLRVTASDEDGDVSISRRCGLRIDPPAIFISNSSSLPQATAGERYEARLRAEGGAGPFRFSLFESTDAPGLTLSPDGVLAGIPSTAGNYQFQVLATSSAPDRALASTKRFALAVRPGGLRITSACPLPVGSGGASYSYNFTAEGGVPPYRWSNYGSLPTGLFLSSLGKITGLPSVPQWWPFDVTVEDSRGNTARSSCGLVIRFPEVQVSSACPLPQASTGVPYRQALQATGGTGDIAWSAEGNLPAGLTLSRDGVLSGTPLAAGASQFRLTATDGDGNAGSAGCSLITLQGSYAVASCPLPNAYEGEPYSANLAAAGGTEPFSWSSPSSFPAGMRLGRDGSVSGTPSITGTYSLLLQVSDRYGQQTSRTCDLRVLPKALRIVNPCDLAAVRMGESYSQKLSAAGGSGPYNYTATALPPGLRLDADGTLRGIAERPGNFAVTYQVKDSNGATAGVSCTVNVSVPDPPDVSFSGMPRSLSPASTAPAVTVQLSRAYPLPLEADLTLDVSPDTNNGQAGVDRADPSVLLGNGQKSQLLQFAAGSRTARVPLGATGTVASTLKLSLSRMRVPGTSIEFPKQPPPAIGQLPRSIPVITDVCYTPTDYGFDVDLSGYSTTRELQTAEVTFGSNRYVVNLAKSGQDYFSAEDSVRTGGTFRVRAPYRMYQGNAKSLGDGSAIISNRVGPSPSRAIRRCN